MSAWQASAGPKVEVAAVGGLRGQAWQFTSQGRKCNFLCVSGLLGAKVSADPSAVLKLVAEAVTNAFDMKLASNPLEWTHPTTGKLKVTKAFSFVDLMFSRVSFGSAGVKVAAGIGVEGVYGSAGWELPEVKAEVTPGVELNVMSAGSGLLLPADERLFDWADAPGEVGAWLADLFRINGTTFNPQWRRDAMTTRRASDPMPKPMGGF